MVIQEKKDKKRKAVVFDGRRKATEILERIKSRINANGLQLKLVSFYREDDPASVLYTKIKSQRAKEVGIEFQAIPIESIKKTVQLIKQFSGDPKVHGILVQHPTGGIYSPNQWQRMVSAIVPEKDVDGLRDNSPFLPATVKAIFYILRQAKVQLNKVKIAVVGTEGMVGRKLVMALRNEGPELIEIDKDNDIKGIKKADVVISATGMPGIIKADMVKNGAVVIDVGSPKGDVDFDEVVKKASFVTPVPGGVGPMTVACLLENVVQSVNTHTQGDS
jgi:methylenetetrahydrofolate dehydrogenase (NADP+)/methenyltetrahydrofolate cyclohydrolase